MSRFALGILCMLAACSPRLPEPPALTAVIPAETLGTAVTPVSIRGGPFTLRVAANLDAPTAPQPLGTFSAALVSDTLRVNLTGVQWVSRDELSAEVPTGVPGGLYQLEVKDPWERTTLLEAAFTVAHECLSEADCDDQVACTADLCVELRCQNPLRPGFCLIEGACQEAGAADPARPCMRCRPETAPEAWSPAINGTACSDGDACTLGESCQGGSCTGPTAVVSCPGTACLEPGTCDPQTGVCQQAEVSGACDDGYDCTSGDSCQEGSCRGTPVCGDTQPRACLVLSTQGAIAPASLTLDPSCSSDLETPTSQLQVRWDLDGDQAFDTLFAPLAQRPLQLAVPGLYRLTVEVKDAAGNLATASRHVAVVAPAEAVVVTTASDEEDPGATPQAPGGSGLSLREAILYVNGLLAKRTLLFSAPMTVLADKLPPLEPAGSRLAGGPGIQLDFSAASLSGPCLTLAGPNQAVLGVELAHCPELTLLLDGEGAVVMDSLLRDGFLDGVQLNADLGRLGPGVEVRGFGQRGVHLRKDGTTVEGANIHHNALQGLDLAPSSGGAWLSQNLLWENGLAGIKASQGSSAAVLWHNTVHANAADGVNIASTATEVDLRNNLLTGNLGFGLNSGTAPVPLKDPNGVFGNALGSYSVGVPDAGSVEADPGYLAPLLGDFRLRPGSPMIDAGTPLAVDVNGPSEGSWFGPAPDLGAHESPH